MTKFRKPFAGVLAGEIYPRDYAKGDECPPELLDAAMSVGAVRAPKPPTPDPDPDPEEDDDDGGVDAVVVEDPDAPADGSVRTAADASTGA